MRCAFASTPKTRAAFSPKICSFTGRVSAAYLCFSISAAGISKRRNASICHCGVPYQIESVPHSTWSAPKASTICPSRCAQAAGWVVTSCPKVDPSSMYTFLSPAFFFIAQNSVVHGTSPDAFGADTPRRPAW